MMNSEYVWGFLVGAALVLILFAVVWKVSGSKSMKGDFDERQMLIRGIGYKYGFFTSLIMMAAYLFLSIFFDDLPVYPGEVMMGTIIVSVVVYALYLIRKDAFFGIRYQSKGYIILLIVVVAANLLGAGYRLFDGEWVDASGHIDFGFFSNSMCVLGFGIILIAIFLRNIERIREELTDEES